MNKAIIATIVALTMATTGCDANGERYKVQLYSGGKLVRTWISTGEVVYFLGEGYRFRDSELGVDIKVRGDVVISPLQDDNQ